MLVRFSYDFIRFIKDVRGPITAPRISENSKLRHNYGQHKFSALFQTTEKQKQKDVSNTILIGLRLRSGRKPIEANANQSVLYWTRMVGVIF